MLRSASKRIKQDSEPKMVSTSQEKLHDLFISETDLNRLFKSGHVSLVQGQLQYEPNLNLPPKREKKSSELKMASTSMDEFRMIRIGETDLNRLLKSGHVDMIQGQLQYHESN